MSQWCSPHPSAYTEQPQAGRIAMTRKQAGNQSCTSTGCDGGRSHGRTVVSPPAQTSTTPSRWRPTISGRPRRLSRVVTVYKAVPFAARRYVPTAGAAPPDCRAVVGGQGKTRGPNRCYQVGQRKPARNLLLHEYYWDPSKDPIGQREDGLLVHIRAPAKPATRALPIMVY